MKKKPVKPDDLSPIEACVYDFITKPPPLTDAMINPVKLNNDYPDPDLWGELTDAFGFPVTKRTRTRAAQEGYDVVVVRGVAYFVDTQDHISICE